MSFRWTSSYGTTNAIRHNYCKQEYLRHEVLKGVNAHDKLGYEDKEASAK